MLNPPLPDTPLARPSEPTEAGSRSAQPTERRPWRTPSLERLPLAETRIDAGTGIDGSTFSSIPG
jgi:hypothetical protein